MSLIELRNIYKLYNEGKPAEFAALNNINLNIDKGEFIAIKGASGSGKSTLLHIIGCIDTCSKGEYIFNETNIGNIKSNKISQIRNQNFGFVLQDFGLINYEVVLKNVYLPLMFNKTPINQMSIMATEKLEQLSISHLSGRNVEDLSGGEKQRVAIARALINDPDVILADEPTGALDSKNSEMIMDIFATLNEAGKTVIVITHEDMVAQKCKRIIQLSDGKITELASRNNLHHL